MYEKKNTLIFSSVYLWNDIDSIKGTLHLTTEKLVFVAEGFEQTSLQLSISLLNISKIMDYKLYDISVAGLQISTYEGEVTIFILEDVQLLKKKILDGLDNNFRN